ncbi:ORF40m [Corchorus olitorius]|uniref:ORF40m n=1 Tax=Corchorus olitorius TaxID=93759 RepID=A0A1R3L1Z8_9ROSI|nr:ORF40m [Corchorus olitorius]
MAEWLKRPTHNWRIRRFNSYWMHANRDPPISLSVKVKDT